ncbi:hypothetical protein E4T42_09006 [Aureobasidium subglaciale]|nr:hypothetical protein E4T42_09006 [Aureobasidium subglaciale]
MSNDKTHSLDHSLLEEQTHRPKILPTRIILRLNVKDFDSNGFSWFQYTSAIEEYLKWSTSSIEDWREKHKHNIFVEQFQPLELEQRRFHVIIDLYSRLHEVHNMDLVHHEIYEIQRNNDDKTLLCIDVAGQVVDLWWIEGPGSVSASPTIKPYSRRPENEIDKAIRRCIAGTGKWGKASDYIVMRSMIPQIAQHLNVFSMIGIAHGDMNAHNFIVKERLELKEYVKDICLCYQTYLHLSVIDWDWTFEAPLPAVIQYPWFIADVLGWHNDSVEPGETFEYDRNYLIEAPKVKEKAISRVDTVSALLV